MRTIGMKVFGVTGRLASDFAKVFEILLGEVITEQVEHRVLKGTSVTVREDETIAVNPGGVLGAELHGFSPKNVRHRSATHGRPWVARVGGLGLIGRNGADRVDAELFQIRHDDELRV